MNIMHSRPARRGLLAGVSVALLLLVSAVVLPAANVTVNCPAESVNDALAGLSPDGPNTINITGECVESVNVQGFRNLRLNGPAVLLSGSNGYALRIAGSEEVTIANLTFRGPGTTPDPPTTLGPSLVVVERCSRVRFDGCTIEKSSGNGLQVDDSLYVEVWPGTLQDNHGAGMQVNGFSKASVGFWWYGPDSDTIVQRNGTGIVVDGGGELWVILSAIVRENRGNGVSLGRGSHMVGCCTGPPPNDAPGPKFLNNGGWGIAASNSSVVQLWALNLVEGNLGGGIYLGAATAALWGGTVIRGNGDPSSPYPGGGLKVEMNSSAGFDATLLDNVGSGVSAYQSSALGICSPRISGNTLGGVSLLLNSSGHFWDCSPADVTGNAPYDVICDVKSTLIGNKTATIGKKQCPGYSQDFPGPAFKSPNKPTKPVKTW